MIEKEKRKPELGTSWFRTTGVLVMLVGLGIWLAGPLLPNSVRPDLKFLVPLFCGLIVLMCGFGLFVRYTASGEPLPVLHQIRQHPDHPLIVQQWNGRAWVDTLDLRAAVNDARKIDSSD